jgi:hypothetical protein
LSSLLCFQRIRKSGFNEATLSQNCREREGDDALIKTALNVERGMELLKAYLNQDAEPEEIEIDGSEE